MARDYIDKLNIDSDDYEASAKTLEEKNAIEKKWADQREKYGFDVRQTWSLDYSMLLNLYERLKMFMEVADDFVDLTYHKFDFEDKSYTQRELILLMIERAEFALSQRSEEELIKMTLDEYAKDEKDKNEAIQSVWDIWAKVRGDMWW